MSGDPFRRPRLVVVGNGMAGMRAVEELISRAPDRFDITVIGAEPHPNYSRILLSAVLAGERTFEDIVLNSRDWYEQHGICLGVVFIYPAGLALESAAIPDCDCTSEPSLVKNRS